MMAEARMEYTVLHAPGWPGGIHPHPNTLEEGRRFVKAHGGTLKWRWISDWEPVPVEDADKLRRQRQARKRRYTASRAGSG